MKSACIFETLLIGVHESNHSFNSIPQPILTISIYNRTALQGYKSEVHIMIHKFRDHDSCTQSGG